MTDQTSATPDTIVSPGSPPVPASRRRLFVCLGLVALVAISISRFGIVVEGIVLPAHARSTPELLIIPGKVVSCSDDNFSESTRYIVDDSSEQPVVRTVEAGRNDDTILSVDLFRHVRSPHASIRIRAYTANGSVRDTASGELRVCSPPSGPSPSSPSVLRLNATSGAAWEAAVTVYVTKDPAAVGFRDIELTPAD